MIEKKISNEELEKVSYSRLATNPGARTSRGESAMSGEKLKERMDEPFKLFQRKFNDLVAFLVGDEKGDSLIKHIPTGIGENHTLADMISNVISESAEFASYLSVGELTLLEKLVQIDKVLKGHDSHVADQANPHGVTAKQLGLERVDNTSDEEKPLSAAVRAAFAALGGELSAAEAELIDRIAQALISAKFYADDTKVGKVGDQVIEGGLSISGDLLVGGDTFAKQIESLEVGDAVIIANADGVLLSELSGYVIRVNGDSAYAIVYDPADDCVKIGLGTYNSETKLFVFGEGEAQVLATRDAIADGHVPVWNDAKKTFEDSGKSADKVVERGTDIPNGEIPVLKDGKLIGSGKTISSFASKDSAQVVANALKGSASGEIVALKDVSPLEHNLGVRVSSENLIPYPYNQTTKTINGITFTDNGDGSITVNGTATDKAVFTIFYTTTNTTPEIKPPFTLSGNPLNGSTDSFSIQLSYKNSDGKYKYVIDIGNGKACNETDFVELTAIYIIIGAGTVCENLVFYPQVEKGAVKTAYTPYVADIEAVKLRALGKNFLDLNQVKNIGDANQTIEVNDNSVIVTPIEGTTVMYGITFEKIQGLVMGETYTASIGNITGFDAASGGWRVRYADGSYKTTSKKTNSTFTVDKEIKQLDFYIGMPYQTPQVITISNIQLEKGTTATEHEPYIEPIEYTVNADGTVDGVKSISPSTTLTTDTPGTVIECKYNRDINKAFAEMQQAIISLGGNV